MCLLAGEPRGLRGVPRIGAVFDDASNVVSEPRPDVVESGSAAVVLSGIVEQCRHGFVLASAVAEHDRRHAHEMS